MQQHTYEISPGKSLVQVLETIQQNKDYQKASDKLLIVYEPNCDSQFLDKERKTINKILPDVKIAAMTTFGPLHEKFIYQKHTRLSLFLFESSHVTILESDCLGKTQDAQGISFGAELKEIPDLKGVLCFSSNASFCPANLIQELLNANPNVPVFGAQAGTHTIAIDESTIFSKNRIYEKGIILVAFSGKDLEIQTEYCLGWKPLGKEHVITKSDSHGFVATIDDNPPEELYAKYLNVHFSNHFTENVCAFPLIAKSSNTLFAKVPIRYSEDGKLSFPAELKIGTKIYFSYAKPESLLQETLSAANRIAKFQPHGILLFACVNRQLFMGGEKAMRELQYFAKNFPSTCTCYGYGEILQTKTGGGVLSSSIVAVAFREGPMDISIPIKPIVDRKLFSQKKNTDLADQLITFLEKTTEDLNHTIDQLADMAEHDPLTGLFNRRKLNEYLEYELGKRHKDGDFSVLMYDIDFFKDVNDKFGHNIGDQVLTRISEIVRNSVRACDIVARWGGEEFVCILPNTKIGGAEILAERLRKKVEKSSFAPLKKLTISLGATEVRTDDSFESLIIRLDKALYDAKKTGRNRYCIR